MRKSIKQITITAAAVAAATFLAFGATSAIAAVGNGGPGTRGGDATQAYPGQDSCMQSPASTAYAPCPSGGGN